MATLHPRLAADTRPLGETDLCWLRWMNDRRFAWLIVVPKRDGLREWHHLPEPDQQRLLATVNHLAGELESCLLSTSDAAERRPSEKHRG